MSTAEKHKRRPLPRKERVVPPFDPDKPFTSVATLVALGFGAERTVYEAIARRDIPSTTVGKKRLVPTSWVLRQLSGDPAA
jgi:hypothetical protein